MAGMIVMGRIVAPFGINGWLKIQLLGDDPLSWKRMPAWWLGENPDATDLAAWQEVVPGGLKLHGKGVVVAVQGLEDRTVAEAYSGWYLAAPRESLPKPGKDEYYWTDLIGLRVIGRADCPLGMVSGLLETGAHDVLQVRDGEVERLIPFVAAYVGKVDLERGEIQVDWESDW